MNKTTTQGFVLLATLLFMQALALLSCFALIEVSMALKASRHDWQKEVLRLKIDTVLHRVEKNLVSGDDACKRAMRPKVDWEKLPLSVWEKEACSDSVDEIRYYYVVEDVGQDECSIIIGKNKGLIAHFYRITLLALPRVMQPMRILVQSTFVKSDLSQETCQTQGHYVFNGRQTWREW